MASVLSGDTGALVVRVVSLQLLGQYDQTPSSWKKPGFLFTFLSPLPLRAWVLAAAAAACPKW